ncbi:MAG: hypothetical protein ACYSWU_16280 [Planctomycetota bacterium]|jgi:hypothetical protein
MAVNLDDVLQGQLAAGIQSGAQQIAMASLNLTQGFGVILETLVQQGGGVADDAATMAALRTAIHVPEKGA